MRSSIHKIFLKRAIDLAAHNVKAGHGGPFGAVVVKNGKIVGEGANHVTPTHDPTAHAEVVAIRAACKKLKVFHLTGCTLYASCEPCPMCLATCYWAHIDTVYFAADRKDAAKAGFDDAFIYNEFELPSRKRSLHLKKMTEKTRNKPFVAWKEFEKKVLY